MVAKSRASAALDSPAVPEEYGEGVDQPSGPGGSSRPHDPLFAARFLPPRLPRFLVRRERLLDRITAGSRSPLTLIVGPAGAGKTVLASQWATEQARRDKVVWLTIEPTDTSGTFWSYVLEALRRHPIPLPDDLVAPVSETADHAMVARLAAALADLSAPVTLVLDQFDAIKARREAADQMHFVLRHAAPRLRVVLTTRYDPPLPLHRYRAAGEISEIRNSDLVFDAPAASVLLNRHGLHPAPADLQALLERTAGWAAGLRLSALAMQRSDDPAAFIQQFATDRTSIADYLLTEVLDAQPEASRDLLLRVSVLARVTPDLANTLTGRDDAEWILASLERANAFVEPLGTTRWYRLHPLFAEVLRAHLRQRMPGVEPELHRRAAHWLAADGQCADAAEQAARAGDWAYAAEIIIDDLAIGSLLTGPAAPRLRGAFATMPTDLPGTAPALVTAALCLAGGDGDGCATALRRADVCLAEEGPTATRKTFCRAFLGTLCTAPTGDVLGAVATGGTAGGPPRPGPVPSLPGRTPEFRAVLGSRLEPACADTEQAAPTVARTAGSGRPAQRADGITARLAVAESAVCLARRDLSAAVAVLVGQPGGGAERDVALARALIAAGQRGRAVDILVRVPLAPLNPAMTRSQARLVRAQAAARRHGGDDARRLLCQALQQTRPQDIAPLCDADEDSPPPPARAVTRELSPRRACVEPSSARTPQPLLPALLEPLSGRECDVLRQAAQMQSNAEIATELHVSVNTVKSHLKSANRKLCVNRRRDAVRRARQLKLV
ncbi:LuxR C-terminal-related transcriptional regulator [Streptomyces sp. NPDC051976]|uniref:helix-turn-helix transcriptional regulator n=1 Tax=Streptomyces sp. NPDC051976 TaxID=3154947 RepID=UPI0034448BF0